MRLETDAGVYESRFTADPGRAELHLTPLQSSVAVPGIELEPGERRLALGVVGVPHLLVLVECVDQVALADRGRSLRFHPALALQGGANVNFISPAQAPGEWRMRTYERGVEGETLACGTGAVAAACALSEWGLARLPTIILTSPGRTRDLQPRPSRGHGYDAEWLA